MKIQHKSKRTSPPHPQTAELIATLLSTSNDDLSEVLGQIDSWRWPRSDLNAWTKVLNKFDAILEEVIRDYDVDNLQLNLFTPVTKKTVCEILRFERLLLENSTNRKMFNSYDRLNSLLFTSDVDVLVLALNLLLRPSQQYSAQPAVSHALNISTSRLQSLAKRWPNLREYPISLIDLASTSGSSAVEALPTEARQVNYSFYRTDASDGKEKDKMDTDVSDIAQGSSPRKSASASFGPTTISIDEGALAAKAPMELLADTIQTHSLPSSEKFEVLCRIRAASILIPGEEAQILREKLIIVRLLAVAIFGHTHNEATAMSSLFLYEPDLIIHIAELLQLEKGLPVVVQTAAIAALDALARYRGKIQEVLSAINAGVNHGILMALVRKTVADVSDPQSSLPHSFAEALLSFVTFIASHAAGGNMVVGAGLVPLLTQLIENKLPERLGVVSKTMQLVDNVLYSFTNAFQLFCAARGVEVLVDRIEYEIDLDIQHHGNEDKSREILGSYGELPVARAAVLKHVLRSMHRMMQSSTTAEGLRGLIDMSILKSIKKIIDYRGLFGPSVLPIAINIMATFVHNEPTSLAIIQEAGLPEMFYKAIEAGLEPAIEVIQAIPNAIGALCLNQAGQDQLTARPSIIPSIFSIFTSERHLKVLQDKENAVLIGTAIDELIRHHPMLKEAVFQSLRSTLCKIEDLGNAFEAEGELRQWYMLTVVEDSPGDDDVRMDDVQICDPSTSSTAREPSEAPNNEGLPSSSGDDQGSRSHDNSVVSFIDVLGRFLEGLFQHPPHVKDFIALTDGLEHIGKFTALPCLPYDFANSVASDSLVQVMRTMTEASTNQTLLYLSGLVKTSLAETDHFWGDFEETSKLLPLVEIDAKRERDSNQRFRQLVTLHIRITLLSEVFSTTGYQHGRGALNLLQMLMGEGSSGIISDLGALHRVSIWQNIVLKAGLFSKGIDLIPTPTSSPLDGSPDRVDLPLPQADSTIPNGIQQETSAGLASTSSPPKPDSPKQSGSKEQNAKALKHLTNGLPNALAPFFQAIVKMFYTRRNPEPPQKKQIIDAADTIAEVIVRHISQKPFDDILSSYAYYSVMLGLLTILMVDERTTQTTLHTLLLSAFYRRRGLDSICDVCRRFMASVKSISDIGTEERSLTATKELVHAYGGLKVALHLIQPLISSKPIFESGQTLLAMSRDKKDTDTDYFEPHNFLVRVRLTTFPVLRELWEASWLISAPLSVSRSVVQLVMEIFGAENEEPKGEPVDLALHGSSGSSATPGPDEGRIRQLMDMGFPRSAAERALTRTRNNVEAATELILAHPFPLPPDPDPDTDDEIMDVAPSDDVSVVPEPLVNTEETPMDEVGQTVVPVAEPNEPGAPANDMPTVDIRSAEELRSALNEARDSLKVGIAPQALRLVDEHLSLVFDLQAAFVRHSGNHQEQAVHSLVDDIKRFSPSAYDMQEQPLANRCRLLALVLAHNPSSLNLDMKNGLMDSLLALLLSSPVGMDDIEHSATPKWLPTHLLVTEALLTLGDQPRPIAFPKEGEPIITEDITAGPAYPEARAIVFDFCLRLLAIPGLPNDDLLSVLRLFVLLTRDYKMACQFVKRDGITLLFKRLKTSSVPGSHSYIAIILRHLVEDQAVLQLIMHPLLKRYFSQPRTRTVDVDTYLRNCSAMALRDPSAFIQATESVCRLTHPFNLPHRVALKPDVGTMAINSDPKSPLGNEVGSAEIPVDQMSPKVGGANANEAVETIVHFLISELMNAVKASNEPLVDTSEARLSAATVNEIPGQADTEVFPKEERLGAKDGGHDHYAYSCFLMQCLTEMLFSYDSCKIAFLSYSPKKRSQTTTKEPIARHRNAALSFLLSDLISFGSVHSLPTDEARRRVTVANLATSVILALCVDSSSNPELKDLTPDLISVRKYVLEAVSRSIKEVPQSEAVDSRYGRLLALADLCHRLLTVRFMPPTRKQPQDDLPTHIAKVMLEKNFVATLTNALSEIDLNYPNVKGVVVSILRPLEYLSKVAIKMSRSSNKGKEVQGKSESVVSESSDENVEDADREETPDLYRNSALGMFGGEMEDVHFTAEDEMDEDEDDEDEDVDMDFGEETGSEDTSNTDDEVDGDGLNNEAHPSTEGWQDDEDEDEDDDEDLVENDDNDEVVGDDDGGDVEAEEIMWQDIQGEGDVPDGSGDDGDEDEDAEVHQIPILRTEGGNDPEPLSDEEDLNELGIIDTGEIDPEGEDIFQSLAAGFANVGRLPIANGFAEGNPQDATGFYIPRRHRGNTDDNMALFGQTRNAPAPPEATTHPLLLAAPPTTGRVPPGHSRTSRRTQGGIVTNSTNELLQTIEDLIGGGAVQLFHHIMTRGRGGAPESIRLDVPSTAFVNVERNVGQRRPTNVLSASLRMERAPRTGEHRSLSRDFDPLFTLQRWSEETRILHNEFVPERARNLSNHVALALLPAAMEAAKEARILEEQELAKQREAEAKAAEETVAANEQPPQEPVEKPADEEFVKQADTEEVAAHDTGEASAAQVGADTQPPEATSDSALILGGDTDMADASTVTPPPSSDEPVGMPQPSNDDTVPQEERNALSGQPETSQVSERITVMIHGSPVDITDTGIDPTFLEALPDDMREEVVNQHVRDQRAARVERLPDSQISNDFLDALPPEIRAEIIQQERQEQARRRGPETVPGSEPAPTGIAAEMDPASFIASLDPQLREVVLLDSDDGFIQTLPSHMIAEAGVYRDGSRPRRGIPPIRATAPRTGVPRKIPPPHDAIQLLDKTGIAVLVRLLFFPQILKKTLLFKVLVNLCENSKTRTELFNLLLNILQDGTGDLAAVDKSFSQMSFRNSKPSNQQTPKAAGKQRAGSDYFNGLSLPNLQYEAIPELVAQRCLEGLTFIVSSNELSSLFFLTEHEFPVGLRRAASKKGKGKERQSPQTHYPIVLLLGLLDRQSLLKTPSTMESVVGLLATVTRPLASIKDAIKGLPGVSTSDVQPLSTSSVPSTSTVPPASSLTPADPPLVQASAEGLTEQALQSSVPTAAATEPANPPVAAEPEEKFLLSKPPQIPQAALRLIVNILTTGDCSGRTFQQSLALIQHLSYIPDARDVIAAELKSKAQEFGQSLHGDLDELATALQNAVGDVLVGSVASKFSLPSSEQAKLLRVLKTIDYMYSTKLVATADSAQDSGDAEKVQGIYESFRFTPLWRRLGDCLAVVEEKPDTEHIATVLLPLIEALMVVCKYVGSKPNSAGTMRGLRASASPRSPSTARESMEDLFVTFTDAHRKILNLMVRNNPSLMSGSFSLLVHNPRVLDFDNKRNYFTQQLHRRSHVREHHGTLQLNVRRARVFEDSFQYLQRKTGDQIKYGKLSVRFYDEEGVDAGGVTREWFQILARQMFDANNALFQPCAADRLTYQPNKNSWVNPEHLSFFKFVGRVIGKAIYDGRLLDAYFARSLYRQLLGKPVDYRDVEWVDPEYYNSLCWILENDPTALDLNFSVEADEFGVNRIISLKEGGESIAVTQENKREFVQLSAQYRLYSSIKDQIESLLAGFYEIIPKDLVTIFNEQELELLISGTPDIDVDEWRAATEYNGYSSSDPVIVWWWRALKSFNRDERAKVLSFATGTSRVPLGGFVDLQGVQGVQRFSIHRAYGDTDRLPQAHTCFNQIDLPQYSSYEMLRHQLLLATNEGAEGFGFA